MTRFVQKYYPIIFVIFILVITTLSFILGYQSGSRGSTVAGNKQIVFSCPSDILDKQKISSLVSSSSQAVVSDSLKEQEGGAYMGSKNGTKYYTPGCPGSKRIKEENIIWFQSVQDATLQGYSKGSC